MAVAVVGTATTFLAWGGSGERRRTSYELVDVADRAGVVPDALAAWTWIWFFVPGLAGAAILTFALRHYFTLGAVSATLGALMVVGAVAVARSPLVPEIGASAGGFAGVATLAGGVATVVLDRRERAAR